MASDSSGWALPDKWSEDLEDENGNKLSKTYVSKPGTHSCSRLHLSKTPQLSIIASSMRPLTAIARKLNVMKGGLQPAETDVMCSEFKKRVKAVQVAQEKAKKKVHAWQSAFRLPHLSVFLSSFMWLHPLPLVTQASQPRP